MIYLFERADMVSDEIIRRILCLLPPDRRQKSLQYKRRADRNMCVIVYWLLVYALRVEYGINSSFSFTYSKNGKPYLAEYPNIFFNLSHCKSGVVCAVSDCELGIDIQNVRPFNIHSASRILTKGEMEQLKKEQYPQKYFCKLWSIKESYIKQNGESVILMLKFNHFSADGIIDLAGDKSFLYQGSDYYICCLGISNAKLKIFDASSIIFDIVFIFTLPFLGMFQI